MFCDFCGKEITNGSKYCDFCGKAVGHIGPVFFDFRKISNQIGEKVKKEELAVPIIAVVLIVGWLIFQNINKQLQNQKNTTSQLQVKLDSIQQQSLETVKDLNLQLQDQKSQTQNLKNQASVAQHALEAFKNQSQNLNGDNLPNINSRAIVIIVCGDSSGNFQEGSGTIISSAGYILTNKHVVTGTYGQFLTCGALMNDGTNRHSILQNIVYGLTISDANAGFYTSSDAAILKINEAYDTNTKIDTALPAIFPYIKPQPGNLKQGDTLFIFGYPGASNFAFNVTKGIVSSFSNDGFINTDAQIDHGNSGGAAFTSDGRFIGIPTSKYVGNNDYLGNILDLQYINISF